ncbi:MAG: AgmX/PglI C-terminal domain-containing protein [Pseudomonadota bacterium]
MNGTKVPLIFRVYKGEELVRTETLTQPVIKIGKLSSSHLRIDDDLVSRMHAVIEVTSPTEISIIDLGSTKGTIVNGQKVNKAKLQDGDIIVLGDTRIVLGIGAAEASGPVASASSGGPNRVDGAMPAIGSAPHGLGVGGAPEGGPASIGSIPAPPRAGGSFSLPPPAGMPMAVAIPSAPMSSPVGVTALPPLAINTQLEDTSKSAIEVAAMLADSVITVKHLTNPRIGKVSAFTCGLFAAGLFGLLLCVIAVGHGVRVATTNKAALEQWVEVERKAPIDFRPIRMSVGWDLMGMLGLSGGLFVLTWGLARYVEERKSPYFRIGRSRDVEFPTDCVPDESFPLVSPQGDQFVFSRAAQMRGEMSVDGKITALDQLPLTMPIPAGARIRAEAGPNTFLVSSVPAPKRHGYTLLSSLDRRLTGFLTGAAAAHFIFLALLYALPPPSSMLYGDILGDNERMTKIQLKPPEEPKQMEDLSKGKEDKSGGTGTKQAGEEGKMGKKDSTRQSGQYAMKNNSVDPQLARMQALDKARSAGILGALRSNQGGAFASLTATGDFSSGIDDRDVYGGLIGNEVGEMQGGFGYGIAGTGPGGGGTGLGTIGLGRYGTIGHGSGTGSGYGIGSGRGGMRGRSASQPVVHIANATTNGALDPNIIRRYIRQKLPVIKHCYEKQLVVKPSLAGTVTTQFTISGTGSVIAVKAKGMGDSSVENCVAGAIQSIQFPRPEGGGLVSVTYPFTFEPAGGQ